MAVAHPRGCDVPRLVAADGVHGWSVDCMTRALIAGVLLGVAFSVAAAVADVIATRRHPRTVFFNDPADFLASLTRS